MKQNSTSVRFLSVFLVVVLASILTLSAFGVGLSIGSSNAAALSAVPSRTLAPVSTESTPRQERGSIPGPGASSAGAERAPAEPTVSPPNGALSDDDPLDEKLFLEAWRLLKTQFYGDLPQGKEVTYDAIRGLVERLGDQHTAFIDPKGAALFNSDMEGSFEGIGAQVELAEGGGVRLKYLYADQPAAKAGLQAGDVVLAVDGKDITKTTLLEAISMIRGPRNSKVVLNIRRDDQKPFDVTVMRDRIEIPVVESKTLGDGKIEYISLRDFSSIAPNRLADALNQALAKKPKGLILDLRGNPGGLLDASVRIGSYFVPKGPIVIERNKDGSEKIFERQGRYLLGDTPLVVLVNGGSASASEIVAGAIQDAGTGILMGEKTYGKGSVQLPNSLSDGSQLRVTIARWFTPKNRGIHGSGLEPDIKVELTKEDVAAQRDPQQDRAVQYLLDKISK
jgi:carboxyl-terminal processing protease